MYKVIDLTGKKFNRLKVIKLAPKPWSGKDAEWICLCDCGVQKIVSGSHMKLGRIKSCGCLNREIVHGDCRRNNVAYEYRKWGEIKRYCYKPSSSKYKYIGAKGIIVCNRWLKSYQNFLEDVGRRPSPNHSLRRINNNGNYDPKNYKWIEKSSETNILECKIHKTTSCMAWFKDSSKKSGGNWKCLIENKRKCNEYYWEIMNDPKSQLKHNQNQTLIRLKKRIETLNERAETLYA